MQKEEARKRLSDACGWPPIDEEDHRQSSIILDFIYDTFRMAVDSGFTWKEVTLVTELSLYLLEKLQGIARLALLWLARNSPTDLRWQVE